MFKNPDHESALLEGYRKPLFTLVMASDKTGIIDTLKAQVLLKVKPELDQFCEGLSTCIVLEYTHKTAERFTLTPVDLTQGQGNYSGWD